MKIVLLRNLYISVERRCMARMAGFEALSLHGSRMPNMRITLGSRMPNMRIKL